MMVVDTLPQQRTWPTLLWTGAGAVSLILAQLLGVMIYVAGVRLAHPSQFVSTYSILHNGRAVAGSTVFSAVATIVFIWGLTQIRTRAVPAYLAMWWPRPRQLVGGAIGFVVFMIALGLLSHRLEPPSDGNFIRDLISSARAADAIPLLAIAVIAAGPISEELAFRGFLYRTIELKFGGIAAIVVTALGWAALHIQYSLAGMIVIFAGGLFFGGIRRYSGSLYLTIVFHGLWNAAAFAGAMLITSKL